MKANSKQKKIATCLALIFGGCVVPSSWAAVFTCQIGSVFNSSCWSDYNPNTGWTIHQVPGAVDSAFLGFHIPGSPNYVAAYMYEGNLSLYQLQILSGNSFAQYSGVNNVYQFENWGGSYYLSSGDLVTHSAFIISGANFVQDSGVHQVTGNLQIGTSSYTLNDGLLDTQSAGFQLSDFNGGGIFVQNGGSVLAGAIDVGGSYTLSAGYLSATIGHIGFSSTGASVGNFIQTSGKAAFSSVLFIGQYGGQEGSYTLSGDGTLTVYQEVIGGVAAGYFIQNGGSHTVSGELDIGAVVENGATYTLNNGALQADFEFIGSGGYGHFVQSGGLHSVTSEMVLGDYVGETGKYELNDGNLYSDNLLIGIEGTGTFIQKAGEHQVDGLLAIGSDAGATGSYNLSGGILNSHPYGGDSEASLQYGNEVIGYEGTGTFTQTGGTHTIKYGSLTLGYNVGGVGTYNLSSPTSKLIASSIIVGKAGTGTFIQDGGTVQADSLTLGGEVTATLDGVIITKGNGTYTLKNDGKLTVLANEYIGHKGTGDFTQAGGIHEIKGMLNLGSDEPGLSYGKYKLNAGVLDIRSGGNFINVRSGEFTQTIGSTLALHIEGKDSTPFVNSAGVSIATLAGTVNVDSQSKVVNGNLQKIVHGDLIPVINARNVNLGVASHITAGGNNTSTLNVTLGNVAFATQFYNNGSSGVGFLIPAHLKYDDHESLGLIAVAKANVPVAGAIWAPVPQLYNVASYTDEADKQKQILQSANNFVQPPAPLLTSPVLSAAKLALAAYSSDPLPDYLTLSSIDVGAFRAVAYQNEMQAGDIVIAVRGSDNLKNWYAGNPGFSGISTDELSQYVHNLSSFTAAVYAANSNASIKLVGHSLGGGLAQLVGYEMGVDAYGFNAPGIGNLLTTSRDRAIFPDDTAVVRDLYFNPNRFNSSGLDGLVNITLSGDVVSGWISNSGLSPKVGQTITLPEDPVAYALKNLDNDPVMDVIENTIKAGQAAIINHSIYSVIARLEKQSGVVKVEQGDKTVALQTSLPSLQEALDRILTPISLSVPLSPQIFSVQAASIPDAAEAAAATAVSFQGSVQEGLFYLGGANPNLGYGFSFGGVLGSPNFQSVLLPFLGDPAQQFEIDSLGSDGVWTLAGFSDASSLFEFNEGGVGTFRVRSSNQLGLAGVDYTDIYFGLTFADSGYASGSIMALDQNGEPLLAPIPEPETYAMMLAGLGLVGAAARRRKQSRSLSVENLQDMNAS